jgi:hypothetical protein
MPVSHQQVRDITLMEGLLRAHGEADDGLEMADVELLSDEYAHSQLDWVLVCTRIGRILAEDPWDVRCGRQSWR